MGRDRPIASQQLDLAGLSRAGIAALATGQGLQSLPPQTLDLIADRTGGNPLFVRELSRLVLSEGDPVAATAVPDRIADVLRRRIARLPGRTQTALRRAAVLGRDVDLEILVGMGDSDARAARRGVDLDEQLLDDLEPAVTAGLLIEPGSGRVRFAHALVRDTLYADLPRMRRTRMHHSAAMALGKLRPRDLAAIAHHAVHAATPATAESATAHAIDAARAAEVLTSHRDAAHWWSVAVDTYELCPNRFDGRTIDMLVPLVAALARTGNVVQARAVRQSAGRPGEAARRPAASRRGADIVGCACDLDAARRRSHRLRDDDAAA